MADARIEIVMNDLTGAAPDHEPVSPALPRVLQMLAQRGLAATFVVSHDLAEAEPFAAQMIENGRNRIVAESPAAALAHARAEATPAAWHEQMQVAVGRAVRTNEPTVIEFELAALERGDAAGAFGETLDLIAGLKRAGSLEVGPS